jgi:hypothetical protein
MAVVTVPRLRKILAVGIEKMEAEVDSSWAALTLAGVLR